MIPVGGDITATLVPFGFGPAIITVNAGEEKKTASCFLLGPLVFAIN